MTNQSPFNDKNNSDENNSYILRCHMKEKGISLHSPMLTFTFTEPRGRKSCLLLASSKPGLFGHGWSLGFRSLGFRVASPCFHLSDKVQSLRPLPRPHAKPPCPPPPPPLRCNLCVTALTTVQTARRSGVSFTAEAL